MNAIARQALFAIFGTALLAMLCWGVSGLPPCGHYPGPYGDLLNGAASSERHVLNVVAAVMFDYRGLDTLGEEFILFASVTGVILLLRHQEDESEECAPRSGGGDASARRIDPGASDLTRLSGLGWLVAILVFGADVVLTGHLSVGGGFQGGVVLASAWLLVLVVYGSEVFDRCSNQSALECLEAAGASGFALLGVAALIAGHPYLTNIVPLGTTGQLWSSGAILLLDVLVGIEVATGMALLLREFIRPLAGEAEPRTP